MKTKVLTICAAAVMVLFVANITLAATITVTALPLQVPDEAPAVGSETEYALGWATGCWQANGTAKTNYYVTPQQLFGRDDVKISELSSISYLTKKDSTHAADASDWYLMIYTKPYSGSSWYGNRINSEPYFSESLNDPADTWNQWVTGAGQDNRLRFFDSSGYFGSYTDPFLSDFTSNVDYKDQEIMFFVIATGSAWAAGFDGYVDGLSIELTGADIGNVNFEAVPVEVWVDDDFDSLTPDWGITKFDNISDGVAAVADSGTVNVAAGPYNENVVIPAGKDNLQILGNSKDDTFVTCGSGTAFFTNSPVTIKGFDISGAARGSGTALKIRDTGSGCPSSASGTLTNPGLFEDNRVHHVNYGMQTADHCNEYWNFKDNEFDELRIGIGLENFQHVEITGNSFNDYKEGVSMGWDSDTAHHVDITDNQFLKDGTAGDELAAIVISSAATNINVQNNDILNSIVGVLIKQKDPTVPDLTNVNVNYNNIVGNTEGVKNEQAIVTVNAKNNWWGDKSGPSHSPGEGDKVSDNVDYTPWLEQPVGDNVLWLNVGATSLYVQPGEDVITDMDIHNLLQLVVGCQAMLGYSSMYLEASPGCVVEGGPPWDDLIYNSWDIPGVSTPDEIDTAIGIDATLEEPSTGTDEDNTIAVITLKALDEEGTTHIEFRADVDDIESTYLADMSAQAVWPEKFDSQTIVIDGTDPVVTNLTATEFGGMVDVLNCANTTIQGTVTITVDADDALAGLVGVPAIEVLHSDMATTLATTLVDDVGPTYGWTVDVGTGTKNGTYTITITATDKAGNDTVVTGTLCVNKNKATGNIELEGLNPPAGGITRVVTFVSTGTGDSETWPMELNFPAGVSTVSFILTDVPDGTTALSAKTGWNLRSKVSLTLVDGQASDVDFIDDDKLLGGDLNETNTTNILDFAIIRINWFSHVAAADVTGDGDVNFGDFIILRNNWFVRGDDE